MDSINKTCPVHGGWMSAKWDAIANAWAPYCSICRDGATDDATLDSLRTALALARTDLAAARAALAARDAVAVEAVEALSELVEVARLRGDSTLPSPCDDPLLWTMRMQEAWDVASAVVDKHTPTKAAPEAGEEQA